MSFILSFIRFVWSNDKVGCNTRHPTRDHKHNHRHRRLRLSQQRRHYRDYLGKHIAYAKHSAREYSGEYLGIGQVADVEGSCDTESGGEDEDRDDWMLVEPNDQADAAQDGDAEAGHQSYTHA